MQFTLMLNSHIYIHQLLASVKIELCNPKSGQENTRLAMVVTVIYMNLSLSITVYSLYKRL